jgi:hypothetical protein
MCGDRIDSIDVSKLIGSPGRTLIDRALDQVSVGGVE